MDELPIRYLNEYRGRNKHKVGEQMKVNQQKTTESIKQNSVRERWS
jgi:hypothetical protein